MFIQHATPGPGIRQPAMANEGARQERESWNSDPEVNR